MRPGALSEGGGHRTVSFWQGAHFAGPGTLRGGRGTGWGYRLAVARLVVRVGGLGEGLSNGGLWLGEPAAVRPHEMGPDRAPKRGGWTGRPLPLTLTCQVVEGREE